MERKWSGDGDNSRASNSHGDTGVDLDSEIDSDINARGGCCKYVESAGVTGCSEEFGLNPRLSRCCKYKNYKVTDSTPSSVTPAETNATSQTTATTTTTTTTTTHCECSKRNVNSVNKSPEILSNNQRDVSTDPINNAYSNKLRTKPKRSPSSIFAISSPETEQRTEVTYVPARSRDSSLRARRDFGPIGTLGTRGFLQSRTMLKCLCYSVLVLVVCMCGGVVMMNRSPGSGPTHHRDGVHKHPNSGLHGAYSGAPTDGEEGTNNIIMDVPYKSVPLKEFETRLSRTRSVPDIMRLFLDKPGLSDDQVNSIVYMKSHSVLHGKRDYHSPDVMNDGDTGSGEKWFEHYQEVNKSKFSKCSEPKPELVRIRDQEHGAILTYFPSCTIVHRCKSETGCCPYGEECRPRKENGIAIIDRHFMVLKRSFNENGETVIPIQRLFAAKSFINHTACECHRVEHNSNCGKNCPRQFRKDRTGVNCDCVCRDANRKCRSIQRGIHPLDESDLECIKKDECIVPQCKTGVFNIATGFCPHFRRQKRQRG